MIRPWKGSQPYKPLNYIYIIFIPYDLNIYEKSVWKLDPPNLQSDFPAHLRWLGNLDPCSALSAPAILQVLLKNFLIRFNIIAWDLIGAASLMVGSWEA